MSLQQAFGVTADDLALVLERHEAKMVNPAVLPTEVLADEVYYRWTSAQFDRVAKAALRADCSLEAQTAAAQEEIYIMLVEQCVIRR